MRVRVFREMERLAYDAARLSLLFDSSFGDNWQDVLNRHLDVLAPLEMELREIVGESKAQADEALKTAARKSLHVWGQDLLLEFLAPFFRWRGGIGRQSALSAQLTALLASTDMHVACLHSLAAILEQSQKPVRVTVQRSARIDDRGVCSSVLGKVLARLLGLAVVLEELVQADCCVAPRVKVGLRGNQLVRPQLKHLAAALHLATYRIVVSFSAAMPQLMRSADNQAVKWLPWSHAPARDWADIYQPRLQSYLTFKTSVLPAGARVL